MISGYSLVTCCKEGKSELFDLLVEHGAEMEHWETDIYQDSLIDFAAENGHLGIVRKLIHHGVTLKNYGEVFAILENWKDKPEETLKTVEALIEVNRISRIDVSEAGIHSPEVGSVLG